MNNDWKLLAGVVVAAALTAGSAPGQDAPGNGAVPMAPPGPVVPGWQNRPAVPGPPAAPAPVSRPPTWPGGTGPESSPWVPPDQRTAPPSSPPGGTLPAGEKHRCNGAMPLGRVGDEVILLSDVTPPAYEWYLKNKDLLPADELEAQWTLLIRQGLQKRIETLLIYQDAKRTIPDEGWSHVQQQLYKIFEEQELDKMLKQSGAVSRGDLELKLRTLGSSVEKMKKAFCEHELARQWVSEQIKPNNEVTFDQMRTYYQKHRQEFIRPARAQWDELMASFAKYPGRAEAGEAIARLGNQVRSGAAFAQVAMAGSDGVTAANGGRRDWTSKGSLVCKEIDRALFSLPVGQLSPIIEGPNGFHIVRVTQRDDVSLTLFLDAQAEIRKKIIRQRSEKQFDEYMTKLKARTPVWTVFDARPGEQQMARPERPERRL